MHTSEDAPRNILYRVTYVNKNKLDIEEQFDG